MINDAARMLESDFQKYHSPTNTVSVKVCAHISSRTNLRSTGRPDTSGSSFGKKTPKR